MMKNPSQRINWQVLVVRVRLNEFKCADGREDGLAGDKPADEEHGQVCPEESPPPNALLDEQDWIAGQHLLMRYSVVSAIFQSRYAATFAVNGARGASVRLTAVRLTAVRLTA